MRRSVFMFLLQVVFACGRDRSAEGESASAVNSSGAKEAASAHGSASVAKVGPAQEKEQPGDVASEPPALLLGRGMASLKIQTATHSKIFSIGEADWALGQESGLITFTSPDGLVATAKAQIVGSFNTEDNTWLWAWDKPSIEPALRAHSLLAKRYGEQHSVADLTRAKFRTTEERAWELTAMACRLGGCQGAYRGPSGATRVFITFGEVRVAKANPSAVQHADEDG